MYITKKLLAKVVLGIEFNRTNISLHATLQWARLMSFSYGFAMNSNSLIMKDTVDTSHTWLSDLKRSMSLLW